MKKTELEIIELSEQFEDIKKKVMTWLVEEYPTAEIEFVKNPNVLFQIRLSDKRAGAAAVPSYITMPKDNPDILLVSFNWKLHEEQVKSISGLKDEARKKFQKELSQGFLLMHMMLIPQPSIDNIQVIKAQDQIILDGLNKHTLINSILRVNCAHGYVYSLFDLIMDQGFNPYRKL